MAAMLETPSRIWRRIEAIEDQDMPSLPSLPSFEHSVEAENMSSSSGLHPSDELSNLSLSPIQSTPAASSHHTATSTIRAPSSTGSAARFANSLITRSSKSSLRQSKSSAGGMSIGASEGDQDSFDISKIPSAPSIRDEHDVGDYSDNGEEHESEPSIPNSYLPPMEVEKDDREPDISLHDALQSISRSSSPIFPSESFKEATTTPKKYYDYSISLKSEPKASPLDKYRNVALRKSAARMRTPSLSRTGSSQASSPANSTPQSNRSIPLPLSPETSPVNDRPVPSPHSRGASPILATSVSLPRSVTPSPAVVREDETASRLELSYATDVRSMDITDVHISPPRLDDENHVSETERFRQESQPSLENGHNVPACEEPTFSSEGDSTPYPQSKRQSARHSAERSTSRAPSSPQSINFTPTPAFPRPRARFSLPTPPDNLLATPAPQEAAEDDIMTPHTRRRSFLLSVINSTARPRLKPPTPHPRLIQDTPSTVESTPDPANDSISATNLQIAFAGITPRPRMPMARRQSHPLAQTYVPSPGTSDSESTAGVVGKPWATPAHSSPYDGASDRASFISTASSHDLTTHHRANASFDPSMGFGNGAAGMGRFDMKKLNNYLHGLNRRLQEENELLHAKLDKLGDEKKVESVSTPSSADTSRRLSGAGRRLSSGTTLGKVQEDTAEGWLEEKAELEDMVNALKEELQRCTEEKENSETLLEKEKEERSADKDRWKSRMLEVEDGVSQIVQGLEEKVEEAERRVAEAQHSAEEHAKEWEKERAKIRGERDAAMERAEKAEKVLESGKELGGALREANERISQVMGDLRNANAQIKELEEEVIRSDARIDDLEKDLEEERENTSNLEHELNCESDALAAESAKVAHLQGAVQQMEEELHSSKAYIAELEEGAEAAVERIVALEEELAKAQEIIQRITLSQQQDKEKIKMLEGDMQKAQEVARQMEDALEEAEKKMFADEDALADLQVKVTSLERERERHLEKSITKDFSMNPFDIGPSERDIEELEHEIDEAHKEISRLTTLLNQSSARKAIEKARDAKIEMLEREKEELLERNRALRMTVTEMNTPGKITNTSGISPIHRQVLSMSIRAPRTPGPLRDMSWLNNTSSDPSLSPLVAEIHRLQGELDRANESIDDKIDKLEDAGLGVVGLTKKLEDARSRILELEDSIARLLRKEDRRIRRLERARCQKCKIKVDLRHLIQPDQSSLEIPTDNLPSEPPTPPTRTTEVLRADLQSVNSHLDKLKKQWEDEKHNLLNEKAALQDAANRLNAQVRTVKEDVRKATVTARAGEKTRANVENELDRAHQMIEELESDLKAERSRLRNLTTEQDRMQREQKGIFAQLQRTESDMEEIRQQLQRVKQENHELEKELRENINAEQKARLLEKKVAENAETIEQLRQERSILAADHKQLQRRYTDISEDANRLRSEYAAHSTSHDNHRHQLDLQMMEIEELKKALNNQSNTLQEAQAEKERMVTEKNDIARTVADLEADLTRVKRDAEAFGRDLKILRGEKENLEQTHKEELSKAERTKKQLQAQARLLKEQLEGQKQSLAHAKDELKNHVRTIDDRQLAELKLQHNKECKGLIVQIHYLKASFVRESLFRSSLGYQKKYLLTLLSQFEKSEKNIFASIARIGFPIPLPPPIRKQHTLKSAALTVVFLNRVKRASDTWREQRSSKQDILAALEEVRRQRTIV